MKPIPLLQCLLWLALSASAGGAKPEAADEAPAAASAVPASGAASGAGPRKAVPVDINTNTDPGPLRALDIELTEARAQAIIDGGPYGNIDELVGQKILPKRLFDRIKGHLIASKPAAAKR